MDVCALAPSGIKALPGHTPQFSARLTQVTNRYLCDDRRRRRRRHPQGRVRGGARQRHALRLQRGREPVGRHLVGPERCRPFPARLPRPTATRRSKARARSAPGASTADLRCGSSTIPRSPTWSSMYATRGARVAADLRGSPGPRLAWGKTAGDQAGPGRRPGCTSAPISSATISTLGTSSKARAATNLTISRDRLPYFALGAVAGTGLHDRAGAGGGQPRGLHRGD